GETVRLRFRLRNVGGEGAFAAVLAAATALGPQGAPERIQPGPRAGESLARSLRLPLAEGMRDLCIDAALQRPRPADPGDPNPGDNCICRPVRVAAKPGAPEPASAAVGLDRRAIEWRDPGDSGASRVGGRRPLLLPRGEGFREPRSQCETNEERSRL
ncbi:MAG: hypothetical protein K8H90_02935, partial [Thermoanaerobaculia bacterium]|nr:hypothetical protein [Thermoanaerobaculia bacterium]